MTHYHQTFTAHPVGQGLFYSLIFTANRNGASHQFKMVFDCGSDNKANAEEEAIVFRDKYLPLVTDRLDLLVISHFDQDHVNKIGTLLERGRKVNKLVMPFSPFAERLFLVLRSVYQSGGWDGIGDDGENATRFALDPLVALSDNLDGGSEVYLIENDPDDPGPSDNGSDNLKFDQDEGGEFLFDFRRKEELNEDDRDAFNSNTSQEIKKVKDSVPGTLTKGWNTVLMEFLFYKKSVGANEKNFYEKVYELFLAKYSLNEKSSLDEILEKVKTIKSSPAVKELFSKAFKAVGKINISESDVINLNTTALCMLHRNLGILRLGSWTEERRKNAHIQTGIWSIEKYDGTNATRIEDCIYDSYYYGYWIQNWFERFPNALLTSDSFLLKHTDADTFYRKYSRRWNDYWLFQVPHHGSKKNADKYLFAKLPQGISKYINYGIVHKLNHPDNEVLLDLMATGQGNSIEAITEYSGLKFVYEVKIR